MKRKHDGDSDLTDLRKRAGELVARAGLENGEVKEQLVGWWFRNPSRKPVEVGSLSHYLKRFLYIPGGAGFLPSTGSWENKMIFVDQKKRISNLLSQAG